MHIEPHMVDGAKLVLGYATAATALGVTAKLAFDSIIGKSEDQGGAPALLARAAMATLAGLFFFEVLPKFSMGVSEVHFILGSTLFLLFGAPAAAIGLALGLLAQGLFFAPADLAQYGMNVTSLLVPLWAVHAMAKKFIAPNTAYVDLTYAQVLPLSFAYQAGVVGWVAFWAFYGQGFGAENMNNVVTFGAAYMLVIVVEPLVDLAVLAGAKSVRAGTVFFQPRLHTA